MDKLLTPQEIADCLGVRPSTIYQWTHQGFIPHVKVGRLLRFRENQVLRWLEDHKEKGRKNRKVDVRELGDLKRDVRILLSSSLVRNVPFSGYYRSLKDFIFYLTLSR
jgi:excisionase family DNA binding protein